MPITYNASDAASAWPEEDYQATLQNVEDGTSKSSGNPMQTWTLEVFAPDGRTQTIKEYVVVPAATFKIKQLAAALGKSREFEAGQFQADDYIGQSFVVALKIEKQDGYDDKNRIAKFKAPERKPGARPAGVPASKSPLTDAMRAKLANRPAPTNPIPEDAAFTDSEIPFDCAHAR